MTPFFFGDRHRRLFGAYDPAPARAGKARAAVICHPGGDEHVHAYRSLRQLAARLSESGRNTLRFDYFGTGDSAGETGEGDCASWCGDIRAALAEAKEMSGAEKVALIGLRLGANLAAEVAAAGRSDIEALVLWDPIVAACGRRPDMGTAAAADADADGPAWAKGAMSGDVCPFPLPARLAAQPIRTHVLLTAAETVAFDFGALAVERIPAPPAWSEDRIVTGTIPADALSRVVRWLA